MFLREIVSVWYFKGILYLFCQICFSANSVIVTVLSINPVLSVLSRVLCPFCKFYLQGGKRIRYHRGIFWKNFIQQEQYQNCKNWCIVLAMIRILGTTLLSKIIIILFTVTPIRALQLHFLAYKINDVTLQDKKTIVLR